MSELYGGFDFSYAKYSSKRRFVYLFCLVVYVFVYIMFILEMNKIFYVYFNHSAEVHQVFQSMQIQQVPTIVLIENSVF